MTFDPSRYLTKVGGADYLEVKWRLVWLRETHPDASIETDLVRFTDWAPDPHTGEMVYIGLAIFKATVSIPGGGTATGWGSEDVKDFRDALEKAECVPLTVPILTADGWKFYYQLREGERVLGYDVNADRLTWTTVTGISTFKNAPLVRIGNSRFSAVCTPDHKWVINGRLTPWNERVGGRAETITLAAPLDVEGGDPRAAAQLGWLMTDAAITYAESGLPGSAEVRQSKPDHFAALDDLFGTISVERETADRVWPSGRVSVTLAQRTWRVAAETVRTILGHFGVVTRDDLPRAVLRMTRQEAEAFFTAAMAADGYGGDTFAKTHLSVVEAVQLAALLIGRSSGLITERAGNDMTTKPCHTLGIHKRGAKYTSEFTTTPLPPRDVWCPTTGTGTWIANFNGWIGVTGNTKAIGRALAALGFGTQFCPDHDFGADRGAVVDSPIDLATTRGRRLNDTAPQPAAMAQPITPRQMKYIQGVAREMGLSDEEVNEQVKNLYGKSTIAELDRRDASALIDRMQSRLSRLTGGTS